MRFKMTAAAAALALLPANPANAACAVHYFAALPVSSSPNGPTTSAMVNGHPVDLFINSGEFYSFMPKEVAQSAGVSIKPISTNFRFYNNKGDFAATMGTVDALGFGRQSIPNAHFIVVGGSNAPQAAILGQNILGLRDAEFDLHNGVVRLTTQQGCMGKDMAYWAQADRVRSVSLETPEGELDRQTVGKVIVNGVPMRALFSTGEHRTAISSKALSKIGLNGSAAADSIKLDIGGEIQSGMTPEVGPRGFGDFAPEIDVIVGFDFFQTHRIYVSNGRRTLFFTANGNSGPIASASAP